jgi:putative membrane protein
MRKLLGPATRSRLHEEGEDPDYRFSLANERTFLAWIRTALALLAGGIGLLQLASDVGSRAERLAPALVLILLGTALAAMSHRRWFNAERAMRLRKTLPGTAQIPLLAYGIALVAVGTLVLAVVIVIRGG